jgi:hypothetical protein
MRRDEDAVEALIVLDVITTVEHEDGDRLLASLRAATANERISLEYLEHVTGSVILTVAEWMSPDSS